jgi:hypothetical protein
MVSRGWTKVPKYNNLEIFAPRKNEVPYLGFRKNEKEV